MEYKSRATVAREFNRPRQVIDRDITNGLLTPRAGSLVEIDEFYKLRKKMFKMKDEMDAMVELRNNNRKHA